MKGENELIKKEIEVIRVPQLMSILGVGRSKAYALMASPAFPSTRIGKVYFVTRQNLEEWLNAYKGRDFLV